MPSVELVATRSTVLIAVVIHSKKVMCVESHLETQNWGSNGKPNRSC